MPLGPFEPIPAGQKIRRSHINDVRTAIGALETAYDVAVANGFVGSEADWLGSLVGPPGAGLVPIDSVATVGALPSSGNSVNDVYTVDADGHAYRWNGSAWVDIGQFKGDTGPQGLDITLNTATDVTPSTATLNIRGSGKQAVDFSGITHLFVPPTLDIRAYGGEAHTEAEWAAMDSTARNTARAANATALQTACGDATAQTRGSRYVLIPGTHIDVYEFDTTISYGSGVNLTNMMRGQGGAQLHYYGAVNTHAFAPSSSGRSVFAVMGVRLEDKRGSAAATGTGRGFNCDGVFNGTIFEDVTVRGFSRNITADGNDQVQITGGWVLSAHQYGVYLNQLSNANAIRDLGIEIMASQAPTQEAGIYVNGGGAGYHLLLEACKLEGDVSTADGIVFNGLVPTTEVNGFSAMGGSPIRDAVRIVSAQPEGHGEEITLRRVSARYNSATHLLRVVHTSPTPDEEYTIPVDTTTGRLTTIHEWGPKNRSLAYRAMPGTGGYSWDTAAAWGSNLPGSIELWSAGAGTGATVAVTGDDMTGVITLTTGTSPGVAQLFDFNFRVPWPRAPKGVNLTPANAAAAAAIASVYPDSTSFNLTYKHWRLQARAALTASTEYKWHYQVTP